ncbi:MAG: OB-fold domain-containing protein [Dehalococcoidia bacterium]
MSETPVAAEAALTAPHVLEYAYTRSVGPVVGRFLAGLRAGKLLGIKTNAGRVIVPPLEYDPDTGDGLDELVEVGQSGVVTTWTWASEPRPHQPLDRPFAWALIKLDGADTAMLQAVDASDESRMATGMRVRARWRAERKGDLSDLECFEPEEES